MPVVVYADADDINRMNQRTRGAARTVAVNTEKEKIVRDHWCVSWRQCDRPIRIDDGAHQTLDLSQRCTIKLGVDAGDPGGIRVRVNLLDMLGEVQRKLLLKHVKEVII